MLWVGVQETGGGSAVWIVLGVLALVLGLVIRAISKASAKRIGRRNDAGGRRDDSSDAADEERERQADLKRAADAKKVAETKKSAEAKKAAEERAAAEAVKKAEEEKKARRTGLLLPADRPIESGLVKTRDEGFIGRLGKLFQGKQIDAALLDQVEEVLFTADIGVRTAQKLLDELRARASRKELADAAAIWRYLREEAEAILERAGDAHSLERRNPNEPHTVLVIGVNGSGKTTSIGKLAHRLVARGEKVLLGAGDTFRAAAAEQLGIWARRVGADIIEGADNSDPSAVLFESVKAARERNVDIVLLDTAGRLHTHQGLLEELKKCRRVVGKALDGAPHEVLLVLDATMGQNAIQQALTFSEALGVTSIVLTKLDGTAKGGVVLGIADELKLPISWVGIGERVEDLRPFDRKEFVSALFSQT